MLIQTTTFCSSSVSNGSGIHMLDNSTLRESSIFMKKQSLLLTLCVGFWLLSSVQGPGALSAGPALSADELLKRADQSASNFKDATLQFKMTIKEANASSMIDFSLLQKGAQKRLIRFLSPAEIKGMGYLIESAETTYALLPGFGNRIRRLGKNQLSDSFMGSDMNLEAISQIDFRPVYAAKRAGTENGQDVLDLTMKLGKTAVYPRLKIWIDPGNFRIARIEYYDQNNTKLRTQRREDYRPGEGSGAPYIAHHVIFIDHARNNRQTELLLNKSQFNTGLGDDSFTQRALQRGQ